MNFLFMFGLLQTCKHLSGLKVIESVQILESVLHQSSAPLRPCNI